MNNGQALKLNNRLKRNNGRSLEEARRVLQGITTGIDNLSDFVSLALNDKRREKRGQALNNIFARQQRYPITRTRMHLQRQAGRQQRQNAISVLQTKTASDAQGLQFWLPAQDARAICAEFPQKSPKGLVLRELSTYRPGILRWEQELESLRVTGSF